MSSTQTPPPKPKTAQQQPTATISPAIHYWGTPVVLLSTLNPTGSTNIAPISSAWWLYNRCLIGLSPSSQSTSNLLRTKQCVLNLPSASMSSIVNSLALTTGSARLSPFKLANGYVHCADKFARAGVTPMKSELVEPDRIAECPAQMEGRLLSVLMGDGEDGEGKERGFVIFEIEVVRTHVHECIRMGGGWENRNRIDPLKWRPMIMSFQELFGLEEGKLEDSVLAEISEEEYR